MSQPQVSQLQSPPDFIDFGIGQPGFDLFPREEIRQASDHALSHDNAASLNYGFEQGDENLRSSLAAFLTKQYKTSVDFQELFITNGISIALDLLSTLFTKPGDTIFVEEPTYYLALKIFSDHQLNIVRVSTDENGLVEVDLREKLTLHQPVFLYTIPVFQNPTGITLSSSRRETIVGLAHQYGFYIIADEVYQLLAYTSKPPLPLASFLDSGRVIALGSFSKILAPGLRLGWLHAPPTVMARLTSCGLLESGGGLNPFTSSIISVFIENGCLDENIIRLRDEFQCRKSSLENELSKQLGGVVRFTDPDGGYFLWLSFSESIDIKKLRRKAEKHNISWLPGRIFAPSNRFRNCGRFCFAHYRSEILVEGVSRLATLVHDYSNTALK